jgi:hypothetical protein
MESRGVGILMRNKSTYFKRAKSLIAIFRKACSGSKSTIKSVETVYSNLIH